ncbi:MAG: CvpA family protein [Candidatus Omnitrophota bacterium]|nr:CvpA family protein [Candidatus Omnitrophota bacterium]
MLLEILHKLNWVDLVLIVIFLRAIWIGARTDLPIELFKFLGTVSATYLSLHYFTIFSDSLKHILSFVIKAAPIELIDFISFVILVIIGYLIFAALRILFYRFLKMEAVPALSRWGGFILSIARGILLASLIVFMLVISSISYFKNSCARSYSGKTLFNVAPQAYNWLWNNIASKFLSDEKYNNAILEVQKDFM